MNLIKLIQLETFTPKSDIQISVKIEKVNDQYDNYVVHSKIQKQKVILLYFELFYRIFFQYNFFTLNLKNYRHADGSY